MTKNEAGKLGFLKARDTQKQQLKDRVELYNKNPKLCLGCNEPIPYSSDKRKKYCSRSCSTSINNKGKQRNFLTGKWCNKTCLNCNELTKNSKFCCRECDSEFYWNKVKSSIIETGCLPSVKGIYGYNPEIAKRYLIETRGHKCEICQLSTWQNQPIPLVLDHINGDSSNHYLMNIRLVCGNCNMLLPTFAGKNRGKGRKTRMNLKFA